MNREIFVSYSRNDKAVVLPLIKRINQELGIQCWIDLKDIESGVEFEEVIMHGIEDCEIVLFMLSDSSLDSPWTKREVYYAENRHKRIVPVLIDGDNLRGWFCFHFGNVDYIDIRSDENKNKLINNLKLWLGLGDRDSISPTNLGLNENASLSPFDLGLDYYLGQNGKPIDYTEAAKWFLMSAEQGESDGQYYLAKLYQQGFGVSQSDTEAVKWYRLAAQQGNAKGLCGLGFMYFQGRGVPQNINEAVKLYRMSAEKGDVDGQLILGFIYEKGHGVPLNDTEATKWYIMAAKQGNGFAKKRLKERGIEL